MCDDCGCRRSGPTAELAAEHDDLHRWLADGLGGAWVSDALRLLVTNIDDEEHDLFPHDFHALDPEQWDEIELAHRAVEAVRGESIDSREAR